MVLVSTDEEINAIFPRPLSTLKFLNCTQQWLRAVCVMLAHAEDIPEPCVYTAWVDFWDTVEVKVEQPVG